MALRVCHTVLLSFVLFSLVLLSLVIALSIEKQCGPAEYKAEQCCPMCAKGSVVQEDCFNDSSTTCIECMRGTYMNEPNGLYRCFRCKACDPGQGLHILHKCTKISDTLCDVKDGFYCKLYSDNKECILALKHSSCLPGERISAPGTKAADTVCEGCTYGHFSRYGINCTAWTKCTFERKQFQDGTRTNDIVCNDIFPRNRPFLFLPLIIFVLMLAALLVQLRREGRGKTLTIPAQETQEGCITDVRDNSPVEMDET